MESPDNSRKAAEELNRRFYDRQALSADDQLDDEVLDYVIFPLLEKFVAGSNKPRQEIRVLDIGAGDTGVPTKYLLQLGFKVTETDLSEASLIKLKGKFPQYGNRLEFQSGDIFEVLSKFKTEQKKFDLVLARAFLHHIPDTEALILAIDQIVDEEGGFISFADPLRYDTVSVGSLMFTKVGYAFWRLRQGNLLRGAKSLIRRWTKKYDPLKEEDMVEYHVVRNGVDQELIKNTFTDRNYQCEIVPYYWSPSRIFTFLGKNLRFGNGFAFFSRRRKITV